MPAEPLIAWPQPVLEYAGFVGAFLAAGAIGLQFAVLRRTRGTISPAPEELEVASRVERFGALFGLTGIVMTTLLTAPRILGLAARRQVSVASIIGGDLPTTLQVGLLLAALLGFGLAAVGKRPGWWLAALGVIGLPLRGLASGAWPRLINPLHELFAGLWVGTLFLLVVVGITTVLRSRLPAARRGALVAEMVQAFSPLALVSAAGLVIFGLTTAWRHLKYLSALWTTPYGYALLVKLALVLGVVALGSWNWRRQRPRLGSPEAGARLLRSARAELLVGGLVLAATAILVSLPSP